MLPKNLCGPGLVIFNHKELADKFIRENVQRYPSLDPDFISQICFEHPDRFNELFPNFNPKIHAARRRIVTMQWIYDNIRYNANAKINNWNFHVDMQLDCKDPRTYHVLKYIRENKTWPFPPVIINANFGIKLGISAAQVGRPYYLVEGTHRVSYANRMFELNELKNDAEMEIIEILKT